ncbi:MAG: PIN domain-containing protein [Spirochaetaceae bacterium]|jgi:predicted nucleic acid-binding protein|nr:PIN domain-containing protein [Spirochaetaceae bacterium]
MNGFSLDSNNISFYLKGNAIVKRNIDQRVDANVKVIVSPFAYYEVKRGLVDANAARQLRSFDELLRRCPLGEATNAVFEEAVNIHVDLKSKGRICDDMDVLIAAFCKTYDLTLVTNNTRHFENIRGLVLADWSAA